jgi:hypothetical protein
VGARSGRCGASPWRRCAPAVHNSRAGPARRCWPARASSTGCGPREVGELLRTGQDRCRRPAPWHTGAGATSGSREHQGLRAPRSSRLLGSPRPADGSTRRSALAGGRGGTSGGCPHEEHAVPRSKPGGPTSWRVRRRTGRAGLSETGAAASRVAAGRTRGRCPSCEGVGGGDGSEHGARLADRPGVRPARIRVHVGGRASDKRLRGDVRRPRPAVHRRVRDLSSGAGVAGVRAVSGCGRRPGQGPRWAVRAPVGGDDHTRGPSGLAGHCPGGSVCDADRTDGLDAAEADAVGAPRATAADRRSGAHACAARLGQLLL